MDSVIYYFSATGNSLKVAKDISSKLGNTKLIKICSETIQDFDSKNYSHIGIVFPVYYYGLPVMVREFAAKLTLNSNSYVYAVATCGGSVGAALKQLKSILAKKDNSLSSAFTIVMPDNYQVMYSPTSYEKQQILFKHENEQIQYIADLIKKGETGAFEEKNSIAARLLGGMLSETFKPFEKDKNFWTDDKCNGCGICSRVCPSNNIALQQKKPEWLHKCEHCLACMQWCPKNSIQYRKGTIKRARYHHPEIKVSELFSCGGK